MKFFRQLLFLQFLFIYAFSSAQDSLQNQPPEKYMIGIAPTPPFVEQAPNGFSGLSIESWEMVNKKLG